MKPQEFTTSFGLAASLALHLTAAWLLVRAPAAIELAPGYEVELSIAASPGASHAAGGDERVARTDDTPREPGSPRPAQNIDTFERGQRGDDVGDQAARLLASKADSRILTDTIATSERVSQASRLRTSRDRATREPERRTPSPGEVVFVASGDGPLLERLRRARLDPAAGDLRSAGGVLRGSDHDARVEENADMRRERARRGADEERERLGLPTSRGEREQRGARVATGRPPVDEGPANTESDWQNARVRDNHDAELLAAQLVESLVDTSTRSGRRTGTGVGGTPGGGSPGTGGGSDEGGRSRAYSPGDGSSGGVDTESPIYQRWFLEQRARIERAVVFPRERALALDQGHVLFRLVVRRDGSLARPPAMTRSSGHRDFDDAAFAAIRRTTPFSRLPDSLARGASEVTVLVPIRFHNPMFQ